MEEMVTSPLVSDHVGLVPCPLTPPPPHPTTPVVIWATAPAAVHKPRIKLHSQQATKSIRSPVYLPHSHLIRTSFAGSTLPDEEPDFRCPKTSTRGRVHLPRCHVLSLVSRPHFLFDFLILIRKSARHS